MCSMRPFKTPLCNKTLQFTASEDVGIADAHQKYLLLNARTGFLKQGDILINDDCSMHVNGENSELGQMLRSVGIDIVSLPTCSLELNPIELVFNFIVQRFASRFNESNAMIQM